MEFLIRRCALKCFEVADENKEIILNRINEFLTKDEQDIYLQALIDILPVKDKSKRQAIDMIGKKPKPKTYSFKYYIEIDGNKKMICKKAFLNLHGVTDKRVKRLRLLKIANKSPHDRRGKSVGSRSNAVPAATCALIQSFIQSIPVKKIHYSNNIIKAYLSSALNIKILHERFCSDHPAQKVTYEFFRNYFNVNFDLAFGRPQIDVCSKCEEINVRLKDPHLNENAKRVASAELIVHKRRASKFYSKIKEITEKSQEVGSTIMGLQFDYMQNLPLPVLPVQEVFYFRQLWVYEFCVHNMKTGKATFYSYHEGQALKGPNEVATCLNQYIHENVSEEITELHLFCDGCPGQNKNNVIIKFLLSLSASRKFQVFLYFPQRGHSYNDCDRDFATVKRKIKREDRLFTHQQYVNLILSSTKNQKFNVKTMTYSDVLDFKAWSKVNFKTKPLSDRCYGKKVNKKDKVSFQVSTFFEFVFNPDKPGEVLCRPFIGNEVNNETFVLSKMRGCCVDISTINDFHAYTTKVPINPLKINDLKKLKQYIPTEHENFYTDILEWPTANSESQDDDVDVEEDF